MLVCADISRPSLLSPLGAVASHRHKHELPPVAVLASVAQHCAKRRIYAAVTAAVGNQSLSLGLF